MKKMATILLALLMLLSFSFGVDLKKERNHRLKYSFDSFEDVDLDIEDGSVIIEYNHNEDQQVEITDKYELYVQGEHVKTTESQKRLLKEFHTKMYDLIEEAKEVGIEGAKIGVKGAKVGITAIAGVLKLLSPNYDSEDLEREVEEEARKLEKDAERLENKADELEDLADALEELHSEMIETFPEIEKLHDN